MLKRYGDFLFFFSSVRLSSRLDAQADAQPHFCVDVRWDRGSAGLDLDVEGWGCRELRRVFVVARVFVVLLPSDPIHNFGLMVDTIRSESTFGLHEASFQ